MCTNILLNAPLAPGDGDRRLFASARVMELPGFPTSAIYHIPRRQTFPWVKPPLANYHRWENRYGFVAIGKPMPEFRLVPVLADGLNEAGLSCACLWQTGITYPYTDAPTDATLYYSDFVAWALGSFAEVEEIEEALAQGRVQVVGLPPGSINPVDLSLHFIAIDKTGASLVVEFVGGQMQLYGSAYHRRHQEGLAKYANGALTNSPGYDWQCTNLQLYSNLTPVGAETSAHKTYPMVGSGLVGLPGDSTPPARFVRAVMMQFSVGMLPGSGEGWLPAPWHAALPGRPHGYADSVQALVNMALQAVQVVMAIPYGTLLTQGKASGGGGGAGTTALRVGDWSDWTVVRDHTNRALYYVSGFNNIPQAIDLASLEFESAKVPNNFPNYPSIALLPPPPELAWYQDATKTFRQPN